jgi:hypothetical protein
VAVLILALRKRLKKSQRVKRKRLKKHLRNN